MRMIVTMSPRVVLMIVAAILAIDSAWAQGMPFGAPHPPGGIMSQSDLMAWIFARQAMFYRSLSGFIRASKDDGA